MIDMTTWMPLFLQALDDTFAHRVWFVGLQGSYARGEATQTSDVDIVVILDEVSAADVRNYNRMIDTLPHRELLCGFLCGKQELLQWEPSDLFQLYYDTTPIKGSLDGLLPLLSEEAVCRAVKIGVCNIYHACVHNMLYDKSEDILKSLYKSAVFVVQAIAFRQTKMYICNQHELRQKVSCAEWGIVDTSLRLKNGEAVQFQEMSETLFEWAREWITKMP